MPSTMTRRPVPALVALVALLLLAAIVWWRVLHRGGASQAEASCPTKSTVPAATLPAPQQITIQVLNSTTRTGIASRARTTLASDGFNIPRPAGNDVSKVHVRGVAEIRFGPGAAKSAQLLHYYLPGARMVTTQSKSSTIVLSLGDKYRSVASASSVTAALQKAKIQLTTGGPSSPAPSSSASC
ncbi:MAG TPA: LytR C-terminal domain-containing protein [Jatrophihabitans sp.]|nr:LytR C-terminal domain-containing protein [Jatrophihabitans sp.]